MDFLQLLLELDTQIYHFINKTLYNPLLFTFFEAITNLADLAIVFLIGYFIIAKLLKHPSANKIFSAILVPVFIVAIANIILKVVFHRGAPTPFVVPWTEIQFLPINYAFPSGHTSRAFALAYSFGAVYSRWRFPALLAAALIGFSRIYIGAHYPADVVAGTTLGIIVTIIYRKLLNNKHNRLVN